MLKSLKWTLDNPTAYGTSAYDRFGWSVAISGNYAIVSSNDEDDAGGSESGKAYIYNVTTGALLFTLNNPNPYGTSASDYFGYSVAISGSYAIVGAYGEASTEGTYSGKAYIYNVTTGSLLFTLDNPDPYGTSESDYFGYSVAISGNYAIVGAKNEDDAEGTTSGKAYIYNVTTGSLVWTLDNPNPYGTSAYDMFGWSVGISGSYAIVGAYAEDDAEGNYSGKAYIYNVTTGALLFTLNNPNAYETSASDMFGISVAIDGNYAIVGAYGEASTEGYSSGKAYIYNVTTGSLLWTLDNPNPYGTSASDYFGWSVGISGSYAIVGAYFEDDAGGIDSGKAYIYHLGEPDITLDSPNPYGTSASDWFGSSVAIDGNYAIVGAYGESDINGGSQSGKAYIFNITTGVLLLTLDNPNAYGTSNYDYFGVSVAISGNYCIVGAADEDEDGGISSSGKAYVFNVTTGALVWTLDDPNAYGDSDNDQFGRSVSMSGNYAIIGAKNEYDANGFYSGKAYIFNVSTGTLIWTLDNPNPYGNTNEDYFGCSVGISGNYAIVGAYHESELDYIYSGRAYIYNVTTGTLLFTLNDPNAYGTPASDYFGYSVAINGNHAIVGAFYEADAGGVRSGKAYVFNVSTGTLAYTIDNPNAYGTSYEDWLGKSVAISGNYAISGVIDEDDAGGINSGKAYIYSVTTGALLFTLDNPNAYGTSASDQFGYSVAVSENYAIISAFSEDDVGGTSSGKVYIFNIATATGHKFDISIDGSIRTSVSEKVRITGELKSVTDMWIRVNGVLKKI